MIQDNHNLSLITDHQEDLASTIPYGEMGSAHPLIHQLHLEYVQYTVLGDIGKKCAQSIRQRLTAPKSNSEIEWLTHYLVRLPSKDGA